MLLAPNPEVLFEPYPELLFEPYPEEFGNEGRILLLTGLLSLEEAALPELFSLVELLLG